MAKGDMVLKVGPTPELKAILDDVVTLIKSLDNRVRELDERVKHIEDTYVEFHDEVDYGC